MEDPLGAQGGGGHGLRIADVEPDQLQAGVVRPVGEVVWAARRIIVDGPNPPTAGPQPVHQVRAYKTGGARHQIEIAPALVDHAIVSLR